MLRLRHFWQNDREGSSGAHTKRNQSTIITAGGTSRQVNSRHPTDMGFSLATVSHARDKDGWGQIEDDASDKSTAPMNDKRIYAERTYTVTSGAA